MELVEEKARIKADFDETKIKPTPGQLIVSVPIKPIRAAAEDSPESPQIVTPTISPRTSKPQRKDVKIEESVDNEVREEDSKKKGKVDPKKKKSSSSSDSSAHSDSDDYKKSKNDGSDELPKRLFRPRFRAENSADSIKSSSIGIAVVISLIGLYFI